MKLDTVSSAVQAYQGSVPNAASTPKSVKKVPVSSEVKVPKTASAPKAANVSNVVRQGIMSDVAAEGGRIIKREAENQDAGEKTVIFDAEEQADIPESILMQQNNKQIQEAVEKLKEKIAENTEAVFGIHEGTNRVMIKIIDKETKDVIKEFPPEKTLDMIQKVWEMAGIMVDAKL